MSLNEIEIDMAVSIEYYTFRIPRKTLEARY